MVYCKRKKCAAWVVNLSFTEVAPFLRDLLKQAKLRHKKTYTFETRAENLSRVSSPLEDSDGPLRDDVLNDFFAQYTPPKEVSDSMRMYFLSALSGRQLFRLTPYSLGAKSFLLEWTQMTKEAKAFSESKSSTCMHSFSGAKN